MFAEISLMTWSILAALVLAGAVMYIITRDRRKWTTRMMANASLCIALAFILSYVKLYEMPQGGSVTLASMLPIFMFAYVYGVAPGLMVGFAYGLLQFVQGGWFVHPIQFLLDYPLAFAMLGFAGIAGKLPDSWGMIPGILLGTCLRFLCAFMTGVFFWGEGAGEQNVLIYSAVYNGTYLIPESLICMAIASVPQVRRVVKQLSWTR
ncbi:MAG: energy-coupled thiamine transporter ThiT [Clostridia bacterium]|nr:energy-coupled thiamine transporter ThiT [Clostridia bacterium]MBQ6859392.1 energy-coupled thiamine transporter ThiT [Clostridia bacterium]